MKKVLTLTTKKNLKGLLFLIPWGVGFVLFFMIPIIQTFQFSLSEIRIGNNGIESTFTGFGNYIYAFVKDPSFPVNLTFSLQRLITDVPLILVFSFFVAVILSNKFKGAGVFKIIFFLTIILSSEVFLRLQQQVSGVNTQQLTQTLADNSSVNELLKNLQIEKYLLELGIPANLINFLIEPMKRVFAIISHSGIQIFIFIAGLNGISPSLYEAAYIEGATGWETFWKVTFPIVSPLIMVNIIYTIVDSFMSVGNPTLEYIYRKTFVDIQFGYASALAWIYFLIVSIILLTAGILVSKKVFYYD